MKYMGSKRFMLKNGLGSLLRAEIPKASRVVDPFCGAGSIVQFAATNFTKPVIAGDLQEYASVLARAIISRTDPITDDESLNAWFAKTKKALSKSNDYKWAIRLDSLEKKSIPRWVKKARSHCEKNPSSGVVWRAYGGHYFSPKQALEIDYLRKYLPKKNRDECLAALIVAASRSAAAPGHTAQPFQPTSTAKRFIKISWGINIFNATEKAWKEIAPVYAQTLGSAYTSDALTLTSKIRSGDLVIVDPPYSGVQYSRFYHVLETIARGKCGKVAGRGRYPSLSERPQSDFSNAGVALTALEKLLSALAKKKATVIFTFPRGQCSNGLSGDLIIRSVEKWFDIEPGSRIHAHDVIVGRFSTLGGNNKVKNNKLKNSRIKSEELLLLLKPRIAKAQSKSLPTANNKITV